VGQLLTLLFTDVEGSTVLLRSLGRERYAIVLADHHRLLADAVAPYGGVVEGTEGDGAFVVFESAASAVGASFDAQLALSRHEWPMDGPLRVRMGLHTGEVDRRDGQLIGLAIHEAARISAAANGGQVLLSAATAALVGEELPGGAELVDLGSFQLKDLPGDHRLLRLRHPNLPGDTRAPRVSEASLTNLPATRSVFVGRQAELAEVRELVDGHRLVTIAGAGGAGKTRLALEVARSMIGSGFDGVWMVELTPIGPSDDLMAAVAAALSLPGGLNPFDVVSQRLRAGTQLVLLDNCEHVLDAASRVSEALLDACPALRLLATSREPLAVAGERVWRVPSLSLPDPSADVGAIERSDAVLLFLERVRSASGTISAAQLGDVAAICRRLDGIPLAIELAASRARVLSPRQLLERLDDAFRLLVGNQRDRPPHQQTLRATIEWSHDLLNDDERVLFRRLSVFVGWFSLEAIEAVAAGDEVDALDVVEIVAGLVDRSMLVVEHGDDETRYRLLETVRQYAAEQLERGGEFTGLRIRHLRWYLQQAAQLSDLVVAGVTDSLQRMDADERNMEAALTWAADHYPGAAEELAAHLAFYWFARRRMREAVAWMHALFGEDDTADSTHRLRLLLAAAMSLRESGGPVDEIRSFARRGSAMADRLGDPKMGSYCVGVDALLPGADRLALAREATDLARQSGDAGALGTALCVSMRVFGDAGLFDDAASALKEARALSDPHKEPTWWAYLLVCEADLALVTGRPADAAKTARRSLTMIASDLSEQAVSLARLSLGAASLDLGDVDAATDAYTLEFEMTRRLPDLSGQGIALAGLAAVAAIRSQHETAARMLGAARALPSIPGMSGASRRGYEVAERLGRDALGDRFDALVTEGAALTTDEAAALAL
jgi:predicted ATPase/class 3 adenylate cyclase